MKFRKVIAIIRPERLEAVEKALKQRGVPGISVTKVKGFGEYANFYSPEWLSSHVRIEVIIDEQQADKLTQTVMDASHTGVEGDGIIAVLPVESVYHIRTRQKCESEVCD